jgi:hypothetical protein
LDAERADPINERACFPVNSGHDLVRAATERDGSTTAAASGGSQVFGGVSEIRKRRGHKEDHAGEHYLHAMSQRYNDRMPSHMVRLT